MNNQHNAGKVQAIATIGLDKRPSRQLNMTDEQRGRLRSVLP
jgi:hypothetical protein